MTDADKKILDDLDEGCLYVFKKGVLQEIEVDPFDTTKKVRITEEAFKAAVELQSSMRKNMGGFRPDMSTICSALIEYASRSDSATTVVKAFAIKLFQSISEDQYG